MSSSVKWFAAIIVAVMVGILFRGVRLEQRCMHTDEAVHAYKFGDLLEKGEYFYDPQEYHGPTLNYFTLIPAWLEGKRVYANLSEFTLRSVCAFFGVLTIGMVVFLRDGLGKRGCVFAAIFTAISPAMVCYSRYYIQEMLLVCFTMGLIVSGWRYYKSRILGWAICGGVFAGLMFATKETSVIAYGSMAGSLVLLSFLKRLGGADGQNRINKNDFTKIFIGVLAAIVVSVLFYSSFFSNPAGIGDSVRTFLNYFERAGQSQEHIHPWYYYFKNLLYYRYADGPIFSGVFIVLLAMIGFASGFGKNKKGDSDPGFVKFLGFYMVIMAVVYSAIPYKTPWCMLGFLGAGILLAGVGASRLFSVRAGLSRYAITAFIFAVIFFNIAQAYQACFVYYDDSRNPYVYGHTGRDVYAISERIIQAAEVADGDATYIEVIFADGDYWPLPWYLRKLNKVHWASEVDMDSPCGSIIVTTPGMVAEVTKKLYETRGVGKRSLYVPLFDKPLYLRPQVEVVGFADYGIVQKAGAMNGEKGGN
jgi:uncharacterized protein (TIGR03663 family)